MLGRMWMWAILTPVHTRVAPLLKNALNQLRVEDLAKILLDEIKSLLCRQRHLRNEFVTLGFNVSDNVRGRDEKRKYQRNCQAE